MKTKVYYGKTEILEDESLFSLGYNILPSYRREKIDGYRFLKDKCLSLGAGLLGEMVRKDMDLQGVPLEQNACGKPYLKGVPGISFNISHSGQRVMCAVSSREIGCDVQHIEATDLNLPKKYFYDLEYASIINKVTDEERLRQFYRIWTLKESFMKCVGLGFHLPLREFCININDDSDSVSVVQSVTDDDVFFKEYFTEDDYAYACCGKSDDFEDAMEEVDFVALIRTLAGADV